MPTMEPTQPPFMAEALDRLWAQFLPQMEERVGILEAASSALGAGTLSIGQRSEANSAAHNLAGVLGTFGLTKGTVLARELEMVYSRQNDPDRDLAGRLGSIATELRAIIASRK